MSPMMIKIEISTSHASSGRSACFLLPVGNGLQDETGRTRDSTRLFASQCGMREWIFE